MQVRYSHAAPVAEVGQVAVTSRRRVILILSVPALSLLLPALAVEVADAGGSGLPTRIAAAVAKFLLFYSGVFALIGLSAAVAAGLLATDRIVMTPERRIVAQALHRTMSLIGMSALANHVLLEIMASRAKVTDAFIPFMASRSTFYMGLGTLSSDLFILIIITGVLRRRFVSGSRRTVWRVVHLTAYVAWPFAILHGLLAGRHAKPYVDWSYGACLALVGLALIVRYVVLMRGRNAAPVGQHAAAPTPRPWPGQPSAQLAPAQPWAAQLGPAQPWAAQLGPAQPWPGQLGPAQPWAAQLGPAQPWAGQPWPAQLGPAQPWAGQPWPGQPWPPQPWAGQPGSAQPGPAQPWPAQPGPAQPWPGQSPSFPADAAQPRPAQRALPAPSDHPSGPLPSPQRQSSGPWPRPPRPSGTGRAARNGGREDVTDWPADDDAWSAPRARGDR